MNKKSIYIPKILKMDTENKTVDQIAEELGCSKSWTVTLLNRLKLKYIKLRNGEHGYLPWEEFLKHYNKRNGTDHKTLREWLETLYKRNTIVSLANLIGVSESAMATALRKHNIPIVTLPLLDKVLLADKEKIEEMTAKEVYENYEISKEYVYKKLRQLNLKFRRVRERWVDRPGNRRHHDN